MSRAYSVMLVTEANRVEALGRACAEFLDPIDATLAGVVSRLPVNSAGRECRLVVGHYWLLVPADAPGREGYLDTSLDAPLRDVRGAVHAGGWWGQLGLTLAGRFLVAGFASESSHMSDLLCQSYVQNQFRLLWREVGGLALLLRRDSVEYYDDLSAVGRPPVFWPEWWRSTAHRGGAESAVERLLPGLADPRKGS